MMFSGTNLCLIHSFFITERSVINHQMVLLGDFDVERTEVAVFEVLYFLTHKKKKLINITMSLISKRHWKSERLLRYFV